LWTVYPPQGDDFRAVLALNRHQIHLLGELPTIGARRSGPLGRSCECRVFGAILAPADGAYRLAKAGFTREPSPETGNGRQAGLVATLWRLDL
jgi:hypothetical protein